MLRYAFGAIRNRKKRNRSGYSPCSWWAIASASGRPLGVIWLAQSAASFAVGSATGPSFARTRSFLHHTATIAGSLLHQAIVSQQGRFCVYGWSIALFEFDGLFTGYGSKRTRKCRATTSMVITMTYAKRSHVHNRIVIAMLEASIAIHSEKTGDLFARSRHIDSQLLRLALLLLSSFAETMASWGGSAFYPAYDDQSECHKRLQKP